MHLDVQGRGRPHPDRRLGGGIEAHRGTTVAGFPNLALLSGPNTGTGSTSQVYMIEAQIHYVLELLVRAARTVAAARSRCVPRRSAAYNVVASDADAAHRVAARRLQQLVSRLRGGQPHAVPGTVVGLLALAAPRACGRVRRSQPPPGAQPARRATCPEPVEVTA